MLGCHRALLCSWARVLKTNTHVLFTCCGLPNSHPSIQTLLRHETFTTILCQAKWANDVKAKAHTSNFNPREKAHNRHTHDKWVPNTLFELPLLTGSCLRHSYHDACLDRDIACAMLPHLDHAPCHRPRGSGEPTACLPLKVNFKAFPRCHPCTSKVARSRSPTWSILEL